MPSENAQCALGLFAAYAKKSGTIIDEDALAKSLKTPHAKAIYARAATRAEEAAAQAAMNQNVSPWLKYADKFGFHPVEIFAYTASPEAYLGKEVVDRVNALYMDYVTKHGKGNREIWKAQYKPQIRAIEEEVSQNIPDLFKDYAARYFEKHASGGQIEGLITPSNPFSKVARQAVGNLVSWNPLITALNAFEFTPKALAYAFESGNPAAVLKGMATYFSKTGGQFWKRIPELEKLGVYGFNTDDSVMSRVNLLNLTENPLRGLSYYVGEAIQPGKGMEALERIAFVSKLGNEPLIFLDHTGTDTLALMRYSLASTKMYLRMLDGIRKGNVGSMAALTAFSAMNAIQTGGASAIPAPIYAILPDDIKEQIAEFDDATGLNITKHFLGTDYTKQVQPLGLPILGAGLNIASEDIKGTGRALVKGSEALQEGNLTEAGARILQATFAAGQLGTIPGVNLTSKRFVDVLAEVAAGEVDAEPTEVLTEFAKKTKLLNEPE